MGIHRKTMKLATLFATVSALARRDAKRYTQLTDMMEHYNADFDARQYWSYGCNCLMLGDRPLSDPGHGPPVDPLDAVCKSYKDCAKMTHGSTCIGEFVTYDYSFVNDQAQCNDEVDTCGRALCECDLMLAKKHFAAIDSFNAEYHMFWSVAGWDPEAEGSCSHTSGSGDPQCCGGSSSAFVLYNANTKQCCPDGTVDAVGEIC